MPKVVNQSPLQRLRRKVASIAQLRQMTTRETADATCEVCQITYTKAAEATACQRWHYGRGS